MALKGAPRCVACDRPAVVVCSSCSKEGVFYCEECDVAYHPPEYVMSEEHERKSIQPGQRSPKRDSPSAVRSALLHTLYFVLSIPPPGDPETPSETDQIHFHLNPMTPPVYVSPPPREPWKWPLPLPPGTSWPPPLPSIYGNEGAIGTGLPRPGSSETPRETPMGPSLSENVPPFIREQWKLQPPLPPTSVSESGTGAGLPPPGISETPTGAPGETNIPPPSSECELPATQEPSTGRGILPTHSTLPSATRDALLSTLYFTLSYPSTGRPQTQTRAPGGPSSSVRGPSPTRELSPGPPLIPPKSESAPTRRAQTPKAAPSGICPPSEYASPPPLPQKQESSGFRHAGQPPTKPHTQNQPRSGRELCPPSPRNGLPPVPSKSRSSSCTSADQSQTTQITHMKPQNEKNICPPSPETGIPPKSRTPRPSHASLPPSGRPQSPGGTDSGKNICLPSPGKPPIPPKSGTPRAGPPPSGRSKTPRGADSGTNICPPSPGIGLPPKPQKTGTPRASRAALPPSGRPKTPRGAPGGTNTDIPASGGGAREANCAGCGGCPELKCYSCCSVPLTYCKPCFEKYHPPLRATVFHEIERLC